MRRHIPLSIRLLRSHISLRTKPSRSTHRYSTVSDQDPLVHPAPSAVQSQVDPQDPPIASSSRTIFEPVINEGYTKPFYITSPPFLTTGAPHLGHFQSLVLSDTFARFSRLRYPDRPAYVAAGTSEAGPSVLRAAERADRELHELCDTFRQRYKDLAEKASVQLEDIVSSQEGRHLVAVKDLWERLVSTGDIYQVSRPGWYDARGELCTEDQLLQLEDGHMSTKDGREVQWAEEAVWMFRVSNFRDQLLGWIERPLSIHPPSLRFKLMSLISSVEDVPVSRPRRSDWGLGVPGDETQVVDEVVEGMIMYITSLGYPGHSEIWPVDIHVVTMDTLQPHMTLWPAMLLSAGIAPPRTILAHFNWTKNGAKLSRQANNVVDPRGLMRFYGAEALRWHVLRSGPGKSEEEFSIQRLEADYTFLSTRLGHFTNRLLNKALIDRSGDFIPGDRDLELERGISEAKDEFVRRFEALDLGRACAVVEDLVHQGNGMWAQSMPWTAPNPTNSLYYAYHSLRISGILLQPILPMKSQELLDRLDVPQAERRLEDATFDLDAVGVDCKTTLDRLFYGERMVDRLALKTMFSQLRWKKDELAKHGKIVRPAS